MCSLLFFISCETEGYIPGVPKEPSQEVFLESDYNGTGDPVGNVTDLYYDLLSNESYDQEFWKFDYTHYSSPPQIHCGEESQEAGLCSELDILNLKTYNSSFYITPESFDPGAVDIVYIYDSVENAYVPSEDYVELADITTETTVDFTEILLSSEDSLKTPPISTSTDPIKYIKWELGENMYKYTTMAPVRETFIFEYEYNYLAKNNFVALDTLQNPISEDVIVVIDTSEVGDEIRYYDVYDTYLVGNEVVPISIDREHLFYSYVNEINGDYTQRQSTDCNDNYQKDSAELTLNDFEDLCESDGGEWQLNQNDLCLSLCNSVTLDELCWSYYTDDLRLTGHCTVDQNTNIAFCDTGNNLFDEAEVLYDACLGDCDGENGNIDVVGQGVEPWEDRNCNLIYDDEPEEIIVGVDNEEACSLETYASWDSNESVCYIDRGNGQWDDDETCYADSETCDYTGLYTKGFAPNYLMVSYENPDNPTPLTEIFAGDAFRDCGADLLCNEFEFGYDPGTCADGYSGTEESCCKHNLCWDYNTNLCDWSLNSCLLPSTGGWTENLDPEGDDYDVFSNPNGEERNFMYDPGEYIGEEGDFDGDLSYSTANTFVTKYLNYSDCLQNSCGGDTFEIISDHFEVALASGSIPKLDSEVAVSSYSIVDQIPNMNLGDLNIIKTEWPDSDEADGQSEDYMLFVDNNGDLHDGTLGYISKLIQPYYYYANTPYTAFPTDYIDYDEEKWWQQFEWEQDKLVFFNQGGEIIDGHRVYSTYTVESDTANYVIHKEYDVSVADAIMTYEPTIQDCILITRTITVIMIGPGFDYKFKSETYLKEGYPIVKEDIFWSWPPTFGADRSWAKISSIEFKGNSDDSNSSFFSNPEQVDLQNLQEYPEFNFDPFRLSKTIGLQRFVAPEE